MKHKTLIITLLFPIFMYSQGVFYDIDTEQFGAYARQAINLNQITQANIGVRHQKYITTLDVMLGGEIDFVSAYIGMAWNFSEFQKSKPSATALVSVNHKITPKTAISIYYQPTYNNNIFPVIWQHQIGAGLKFRL